MHCTQSNEVETDHKSSDVCFVSQDRHEMTFTLDEYRCTENCRTTPLDFLELIRRSHHAVTTPSYCLEFIRRSHSTIVMEKQFPWRLLLTFRLASGWAEYTRCIWHRLRMGQNALMWTSKYHSAVGLPLGINEKITPHHRYTTFLFELIRKPFFGITLMFVCASRASPLTWTWMRDQEKWPSILRIKR